MSLVPAELAAIRFFVDEDLVGLGLALMRLRNDVVVGSRDPVKDLVPKLDEQWIPVVGDIGWVVITNDKKIRTRPHESPLAIRHRLRVVHLAPPGRDANRWDFARVLLRHWDAVEDLSQGEGPVWLTLTGRGPRRRDFTPGSLR